MATVKVVKSGSRLGYNVVDQAKYDADPAAYVLWEGPNEAVAAEPAEGAVHEPMADPAHAGAQVSVDARVMRRPPQQRGRGR